MAHKFFEQIQQADVENLVEDLGTKINHTDFGGQGGILAGSLSPGTATQISRGNNGDVLVVDTNEFGGLKWQAVPGLLTQETITSGAGPFINPSFPDAHQVMRYEYYASTASTISFGGNVVGSTGLATDDVTVPAGEVCFLVIEYSTLKGSWVLTALTVSEP